MPNYQNGKIYKLSGNNQIYIGSTVRTLTERYNRHISSFKRCIYTTAWAILTDTNATIELIELYPCNTKEELLMRERYYIEAMECVNKLCPILTDSERKESNRKRYSKYCKKHPEKSKEKYAKKQLYTSKPDESTIFTTINPDGLNLQQYVKHLKYLQNNMN
jgi:Fe-S-cluster containining protein